MASSAVSICNGALVLLGAERIASLADTSKRGMLCAERYPEVLKQLLSAHPWKFALGKAELAADSEVPTGEWEYTYAFTEPSDCLRVLDIKGGAAWDSGGGKILSNDAPIFIRYIKHETDTSKFSSFFDRALECVLALDMAYSLTQSSEAVKAITPIAEKAVAEARSFSAQTTSAKIIEADDWLNGRL